MYMYTENNTRKLCLFICDNTDVQTSTIGNPFTVHIQQIPKCLFSSRSKHQTTDIKIKMYNVQTYIFFYLKIILYVLYFRT